MIFPGIAKFWSWFKPKRTPLFRLAAYRTAAEAEKRARLRNDCRAVGRALRAKRAAIHANLRGVSHG
jgi:hypothetical protein